MPETSDNLTDHPSTSLLSSTTAYWDFANIVGEGKEITAIRPQTDAWMNFSLKVTAHHGKNTNNEPLMKVIKELAKAGYTPEEIEPYLMNGLTNYALIVKGIKSNIDAELLASSAGLR